MKTLTVALAALVAVALAAGPAFAFGCPKLVAMWDEPWQPTLAYPPRGIATLWEAEPPKAALSLIPL